ncbi:hypothetical protein VTN00DRAFT_2081 [Thermoascus crustaceus]|uniref:uncharacterized protein n=1 Tax=Thermoascus crustaceus TaxID=5088 RepID=UPI0037433850
MTVRLSLRDGALQIHVILRAKPLELAPAWERSDGAREWLALSYTVARPGARNLRTTTLNLEDLPLRTWLGEEGKKSVWNPEDIGETARHQGSRILGPPSTTNGDHGVATTGEQSLFDLLDLERCISLGLPCCLCTMGKPRYQGEIESIFHTILPISPGGSASW